MVATRSRGKATGNVATTNASSTTSTLKAPPKRAPKRKAIEAPAAEPAAFFTPAQKPAKRTKTAAPAATKPAAKPAAKPATRTTRRAAKTVEEPQAEVKEVPKPAQRATRGRKAAEPVASVVEPEEKVEEPAVEEPAIEQPTKTTRARKAITKAAKTVASKVARLSAASSASIASVSPKRATRATRDTAALAPPTVDAPLKKPARKLTKKTPAWKTAAKPAAKVSEQEAQVRDEETLQAILNQEALEELPAEYPRTPAHVVNAYDNQTAFNQLPEYPKTPAHFAEAYANQTAFDELVAEYPETPAHIAEAHGNQKGFDELPEYPKTPAHIAEAYENQKAFEELAAEYPKTPAHIAEAHGNQTAFNQLPEYPKTPAHVAEAYGNQKAFKELAAEYPSTPDEFVDAHENQQAFEQMADYPKTPTHISAPLSSREALRELPIDYPTTPAHIIAPVSTREALRELPIDYPNTPAHIMTIKQGLDQLPSYPNTPAPNDVASSPAQAHGTPEALPSDSATEEFESALEITEAEVAEVEVTEAELMEVDGEEYIVKTTPLSKVNFSVNSSLDLAPKLAPPKSAACASPTKSALRSPLKNGTKTPKKQVTWPEDFETEEDDDTFDLAMLLHGTRFLVDVTSKGEDQSLFYVTSLEDFGAQVVREWTENTTLTHVIFKDGSQDTIDKVRASNGAVKCINTGWLMEVEATKKRVDESKFAIDLDTVSVCTPVSRAPRRRDFFTPAKTPTRFLSTIESSSAAKSIEDFPDTPTSSDFDQSMDTIEDKENNKWEGSTFAKKFSLSAPARKPWRKAQAPTTAAKTPTKENQRREAPVQSSVFSERPIKSAMFSQPPVKNSFGHTAAESLFDQPPIKGPLFAPTPKLGEAAAKDSLFSHGPIKRPLFAPTPKNGQNAGKDSVSRHPPIKGPLFEDNPKLNFAKMSPKKKNTSLFGQSLSKPGSVGFAPAVSDTWFDLQGKNSTLLGQGPVKSSTMSAQRPGRLSALLNKGAPSTPTASRVAPATTFLSTHKKRTASETFGGSITATPAKKFRPLF
ncbi:hypothetical protein PMIN01_07016 [Paraphaeosphaeria minitans]|uniref:BRCT domain-containing protein n=1 Tax=Paraphaeosphaeria minitans TaxID=565426 RepID=A0A9P6KR92_9PLEO|nr:hypothetical protein PMIN01_07016 [Paraphaeosphaeria minitans]